MPPTPTADAVRVTTAVYYVETRIEADPGLAWHALVDYPAWNPAFADATVTTIRGERGAEFELVHIAERDDAGAVVSELLAETTRIRPGRSITWFVTPPDGDSYRNFLDLELVPREGGATLQLRYYAQVSGGSDDERPARRAEAEATYADLAHAFKKYVESATTAMTTEVRTS